MYKKRIRLRRCKKFRFINKNLGKLRLVVYKTSKHIYSQVIFIDNNNKSNVLLSMSTLEIKGFKKKKICNKKASEIVGRKIAKKCLKKKIYNVVFDKSGFKYHGRIKILADSARKNGLLF